MAELNKIYKHTFDDLINLTNEYVKAYKHEVDDVKKQFILVDLIMDVEEAVEKYCRKFKMEYEIAELDLEEAYGICMGKSLNKTLIKYDEREGNFLSLFYKVMKNDLIDQYRHLITYKEKFNRSHMSGDVTYVASGEGGTLFDSVIATGDFSEIICSNIFLQELIGEFEQSDPYGFLIRLEMYGNTTDKTRAILKALGVENYDENTRQIVSRTRKRFKKLLVTRGFDLQDYIAITEKSY